MLRAIWRWFGWCWCVNFTQWDDHVAVRTRAPKPDEAMGNPNIAKVREVFRWQERKCRDCGRLYQRSARFAARVLPEEEKA